MCNRSQWNGGERFITEELKRRDKSRTVGTYEGKLKYAINDMIAKRSENWVFVLLVIGQASFTAEAGTEGKVFGHWNFAYLKRTDIGLRAPFVDYQGPKAVQSTRPVRTTAGDLLAEPGSQETPLIAVDSKPWRALIPTTIIRAPIEASEPKQKNPMKPHANAATRATKTPAVEAVVSTADNRRPPTPRREKSGKRKKSKR